MLQLLLVVLQIFYIGFAYHLLLGRMFFFPVSLVTASSRSYATLEYQKREKKANKILACQEKSTL